jgi:hypothetical protein
VLVGVWAAEEFVLSVGHSVASACLYRDARMLFAITAAHVERQRSSVL